MLLIILGILIPFIGTTIGSLMVFFLKNNLNIKYQKLINGFSGGVMLASSIFSLLLPSLEDSKYLTFIGLFLGIFGFLIIGNITSKLEKKKNMLALAVTLHNIPEGMAVGVVFANAIYCNSKVLLISALCLSIGIAIQNIPEGAIISMPLKINGFSKIKSFIYGMLSGIVEPIASIITLLLTSYVVPIMPFLLSFAAGAMIYVVISELTPRSDNDNYGISGFGIGFILMMLLDVILG